MVLETRFPKGPGGLTRGITGGYCTLNRTTIEPQVLPIFHKRGVIRAEGMEMDSPRGSGIFGPKGTCLLLARGIRLS